MERNQRVAINAFLGASTFYGLEALKVEVQLGGNFSEFHKGHTMLLNDITEYQTKVADILAKMLYDYSVLACYGELRHMNRQAKTRYKGVGTPSPTLNRDGSYNKAILYNPNDILDFAIVGFDKENKWNGAYGGQLWQMIAKHAKKYGTISNLIFCDTAFSLSHNSAPFLDKSSTKIFFVNNTTTYKELLDTKFQDNPLNVIRYIIKKSSDWGSNKNVIDRQFIKLIERADNLGFFKRHNTIYNVSLSETINSYSLVKIDLIEYINKRYEPIEYMNKKMNPKKLHSFCTTLKQNNFYDKLQIGSHVMINDNAFTKMLNKSEHFYEMGTANYFIINKLMNNEFSNMVISNIEKEQIYIHDLSTNNQYRTNFANLKVMDSKYKVHALK